VVRSRGDEDLAVALDRDAGRFVVADECRPNDAPAPELAIDPGTRDSAQCARQEQRQHGCG